MAINPNNLAGTAKLTFADEFSTLSLWSGASGTWDTNLWWGWENGSTVASNGDQQWYIDHQYGPTAAVKPWTVSNGILSLTANRADPSIRPHINNYEYTSGLIHSANSFSQKYGYFEMSAQLPRGQGFWPAFWLAPANLTWPPEIDIMEALGNDPYSLWTVVHTMATGTHTSVEEKNPVPDMSAGFHRYGVNWQADYITWYFDGAEVFKTPTPSDLHQPMYIIANLALGSYWPGRVDATTPLPSSFKIDYIRVYEDAGSSAPPPPAPAPTINGTAGNDSLYGSYANETMFGHGGNDHVMGQGGSDTINGGTGHDYLYGGTGADVLTGAGGYDGFVFNVAPSDAVDRITDFSPYYDTIWLENGVFTTLTTTGQLSSAAYYRGAAVHDATDRIIYNPATGALSYDPDGTGAAAGVQFAKLATGLNITATDFSVY